jgi:hypothetical protein
MPSGKPVDASAVMSRWNNGISPQKIYQAISYIQAQREIKGI